MILPYYKIEKTEEGRKFFLANIGYFNFWDNYLVMNIPEGCNKVFSVLVNRPSTKFNGGKPTVNFLGAVMSHVEESVKLKKPEEMFVDFPELKKFDYLK